LSPPFQRGAANDRRHQSFDEDRRRSHTNPDLREQTRIEIVLKVKIDVDG
jgi:hypothetical protein